MTGELIQHLFDGDGLVSSIRQLRDDVERIKLAGYTGEGGPSPGGLISPGQLSQLSEVAEAAGVVTDLSANSLLGRVGSAAAGSVPVSAQSVLGRAGSNLTSLTASAGQLLARLSTGDLGFQDLLPWAVNQGVMVNQAWQVQEVTGNATLDETKVLVVLNHTSDILLTLPTPTYSGKVFVVADPLGAMGGSAGVQFHTIGSDEINGSISITSKYTGDYSVFLLIGVISSGVTYWTGHVFAGSSEIS